MPELHTRPEPCLLPIRRPGCPKCEGRMMLLGIAPGPEGFELRTFECRNCGHSFTNAAVKDPVNTVAAGWIAGELKARRKQSLERLTMRYRSKQPITPDERSLYRARFWHFQTWSFRSAFAGVTRTSFGTRLSPEMADTVAKVENRTTLRISRKLIFGLLCCCVGFQRHDGGP